jgi:hypothetical protein
MYQLPPTTTVTTPVPDDRELCWFAITQFDNCDRWAGHPDEHLATCGDCFEGKCHGGNPCHCARHDDSLRLRELNAAANAIVTAKPDLDVSPHRWWADHLSETLAQLPPSSHGERARQDGYVPRSAHAWAGHLEATIVELARNLALAVEAEMTHGGPTGPNMSLIYVAKSAHAAITTLIAHHETDQQ